MFTLIEVAIAARRPLLFLVLFSVLFVVGKELDRWVGAYDVDRQIEQLGNTALATSVSGYYFGIIIVFVAATVGLGGGLETDLLAAATYGAGGILLLVVQRPLTSALLLPGITVWDQLTQEENQAVGVVMMGSYLASALIVAGCIYGKHTAPTVVLGFYLLGQTGLLVFTMLYEWATPFVLIGHLEEGNVAVGIGLSGTLVAIGLLMMNGALAPFSGPAESLLRLGKNLLIVLIHLAGLRLFFHVQFLPIDELYLQITRDRNVGAGLMQFVVSVGFAVVLVAVL